MSKLVIYAQKFVGTNMAEDIVHDVFIRIWNNKTELIEQNARYYLFRSVRNSCLDYLKRVKLNNAYINHAAHELKLMEIYHYDSAINKMIDAEKIKQIHEAINTLPKQCKLIFLEAYEKDRSHNDIAAELGISIRTVDSQVYKALKLIREQLIVNIG